MALRGYTIAQGSYPAWSSPLPVGPTILGEGIVTQCSRLEGSAAASVSEATSPAPAGPSPLTQVPGGQYGGPGDVVDQGAPPWHGWGPSLSPGAPVPGRRGGRGGLRLGGSGQTEAGGSSPIVRPMWAAMGVIHGLQWPTGRGVAL